MIIAIDGPAGAGKSTVARGLAQQLGFRFLDTGAMYRAVALIVLENGIDPDDANAVARAARPLQIFVDGDVTRIGDRDVSREIRSREVSEASSQVAAIPEVREILVDQQRKIAATGDFVCEGRDQGSVVFPKADFKFFVTASVQDRARRRLKELAESEAAITLEEVVEEQIRRDERDSNRDVGALVKAGDAFEIHTDEMTIDQVIEHMLRIIERDSDRVRSDQHTRQQPF